MQLARLAGVGDPIRGGVVVERHVVEETQRAHDLIKRRPGNHFRDQMHLVGARTSSNPSRLANGRNIDLLAMFATQGRSNGRLMTARSANDWYLRAKRKAGSDDRSCWD